MTRTAPRAGRVVNPHVRKKECFGHRPSSTSLSLFAFMLGLEGRARARMLVVSSDAITCFSTLRVERESGSRIVRDVLLSCGRDRIDGFTVHPGDNDRQKAKRLSDALCHETPLTESELVHLKVVSASKKPRDEREGHEFEREQHDEKIVTSEGWTLVRLTQRHHYCHMALSVASWFA